MKEVFQPRPVELTRPLASSTLGRGVFSMHEGSSIESNVVQRLAPKSTETQHSAPSHEVNEDQLRSEWYNRFSQEELQNPDTRSTIEAAIKLGYGPGRLRDKGEIEASEVIRNSLLSDAERL